MEKKTLPLPGPFSRKRASFFTARALFAPHAQTRPTGKKKDQKRFLPFPIAFREEKIPRSLSYTRRSFFFSPWEKKNLGGREQTKEAKRTHTYLDTLGSSNPPGASPDTTNRSSRPRLSTEYRRCPELRSLTRTPYKIRAKKRWICV